MSEWHQSKIASLFTLGRGRVISGTDIANNPGIYPVFSSQTTANGCMGYINSFDFEGELITWTTDGANAGEVFYREGRFNCTNVCGTLKATSTANIDYRFFSYLISSVTKKHVSYVGNPKLMNGIVGNIYISYPSLSEQKKIAQILNNLIIAINQTIALIAKLKQVKQGLLHDLLTRGIDSNGEIRPCYEEAPHLYQESALGWIPKSWHLAPLVSKVGFPQGQVDPRALPYKHWTLIAPDHIETGSGRLLAKVTAEDQNAISGKYVCAPDDIIYSKIRPYLRKAVLADEIGLCSADMYPLRPNNGMSPRFLLAVILGNHFSQFAESVSMRSGFPKINRKELAEYIGGWPDTAEQHVIGLLLTQADRQQIIAENELTKLTELKAGLMDDLLTGRVRVTPLLAPEGTSP
jgi:type I restriction enzyme S subunit